MFRIFSILTIVSFLCFPNEARSQDSVTTVPAIDDTVIHPNIITPNLTGPNEYSYPILITRNGEALPVYIRRLIIMRIDADGRIIVTPIPSSSIADALWSLERAGITNENDTQVEENQTETKQK
jgi:hypothetical protein